jgi:hypothetical protein
MNEAPNMKAQMAPAMSPARMFLRASFLSMRRSYRVFYNFTSATIAPKRSARYASENR